VPRWLHTIVDTTTTYEKISTILLVMFAIIYTLRFYTYDHDVYLKALIMVCSHSFGLLTDFKL
jgi:hypothetical protein